MPVSAPVVLWCSDCHRSAQVPGITKAHRPGASVTPAVVCFVSYIAEYKGGLLVMFQGFRCCSLCRIYPYVRIVEGCDTH